jgi:hypothetical protein
LASLRESSSLERDWLRKISFSTEVHFPEFFVSALDRRTCYVIEMMVSKYVFDYFVAKCWQFIEKQALLASEERLRSIKLVGCHSIRHHYKIYRCVYEMHRSQLSLEMIHS